MAAVLLLLNVVPTFAASSKNTRGGYSIPANLTIQVGEQKNLTVTEPSGKYANVSFQHCPNYVSSSNFSAGSYWGKKAAITYKGIAPGTFTSYVTVEVHSKKGDPNSQYASYTLECKVTVKKKASAPKKTTTAAKSTNTKTAKAKKIPLQSVKMSMRNATINTGDGLMLSVSCTPKNTTDNTSVKWSSSNKNIATVDRYGFVVSKKAGTVTITAKVGSKSDSCKVIVKDPKSKGSYKNVSEAYKLLNNFRTTRSNQWYWNSNNNKKVHCYGLKSLKKDAELEKLAKKRAEEQWRRYYKYGKRDHTRPDGSNCSTIYRNQKINYWGENLHWSSGSCREIILDPNYGWAETNLGYAGQGHRRNMLNEKFTKVGIACYVKDGKTCWAMCLGA